MEIEAFRAFTHQLKASLETDSRVVGLVMLGSAAEVTRKSDVWSDHDFFVITESGNQETFRTEFVWLPDHKNIVLAVRETAHGLKILYTNGHLLEYAVFDEAELRLAKVNDYRVLIDRKNISQILDTIAQSVEEITHDYSSNMGQFLGVLFVGVGRYARGEMLSSHNFIKNFALSNLLPVLIEYLPAHDKTSLDNLDPFRRFAQVFPQLGTEIAAAMLLEPPHAALRLLEIADLQLKEVLPDYPVAAVETVRVYIQQIVSENL